MFPSVLQQQIEKLLEGVKLSDVPYQALSQKYRGERKVSESLLQSTSEAMAYAAVRMPATFGAVMESLQKIIEVFDFSPQTMLDVGAGTGACGWAAQEIFDLKNLICLERESVMRDLGKTLMSNNEYPVLSQAQWYDFDLSRDDIAYKADLVTASYIINELPDVEKEKAILKLWQATEQVLLIVEPGTPQAFAGLLKLRDFLISQGAHIIAPCPHQKKCSLASGDWCHFSARIARSRLHRQLKSAEMGYEDEKYCFMAFSRQPLALSYSRVLKEPKISKAEVVCELCSDEGECLIKKISIKDKAAYKKAKKMRWGDIYY